MTGFLAGAALCMLAAIVLLMAPLLRSRPGTTATRSRLLAGGLALAALAGAVLLYGATTHWTWPAAAQGDPQDAALIRLRTAANESPGDGQAWLRLGNAYLQLQQYALAARAFEHGNRLQHDQDADGLNGLAESLALDGDDSNDARVEPLFNRALQINPRSPKALLYTALSALRSGNLPVARERFVTMLSLGDAPAEVRAALEKQIAAIDAQLKPAAIDARTRIDLHIVVADALQAAAGEAAGRGAKLFVFVRGASGGPPLAARRLGASFPVDLSLSANDAVLAGNAIQPRQEVSVVARLTVSGNPVAQPGDLTAEMRVTAGATARHNLVIAQRVP
jgi:cytochrome c-type biogenesis protein CcmH